MRIVRNGQKVWPYCPDCGCRLNIEHLNSTEVRMSHFGLHPDKDARGCVCSHRYSAWILPKHKLNHIWV